MKTWSKRVIKRIHGRHLQAGQSISKLEAIILASRILGVTYEENEEFADAALAAFEDDLDKYDIQYKKKLHIFFTAECLKYPNCRSI